MDTDYQRVKSAIIYIAESTSEQPSLDEVAAHVGISPYHFQRLFRRWAGLSPKRFLQHLTAVQAKGLLRSSVPVLDAAFAVGLSGSGRLHDLMVTTEAVTPGEYKTYGDGITIRYGIHETPFGSCLIGVTHRGVCALRFTDECGHAAAVAELEGEWRCARLVHDEKGTRALVEQVFARAGTAHEPLPLLLRVTNCRLKVCEGLLRVPEGCLVSYGDLAERLGTPSAARAVAGAVGRNPIAYVIPCHRVLRSTGALGGYRWGTERKLVMLERETAALRYARSMPQKDYILRMIEEFAQVIAQALGLRGTGRLEAALALLDRSAARFAGLSLRQLDALPWESLRALLTVGGSLDVQRCVFLAELRRLEGEIREERTGGGAGLASSVLALRLYMQVVAARGIEGLEERREPAIALADRLRSAPLDPAVRLELWRFELAAGRFGRAEDALFTALDEQEGDLDVVAEGIAVYDSLLDRDDAELAAGDLPRDEVLDGLARLGELRREWGRPRQ